MRSRRILNEVDLKTTLDKLALEPFAKGRKFNFTASLFEDTSVASQVETMRGTDVFLSIHGAGFTNVVFMRPCSVSIEVVPFGYGLPPNNLFFAAAAKSVDVFHYTWIAEQHNTFLNVGARLGGGKDCRPRYNKLPSDVYEGFFACYNDKYCKACSKMTKIIVNTTRFSDVMRRALVDRDECIRNHPFYK
jgi:hypothetical protein